MWGPGSPPKCKGVGTSGPKGDKPHSSVWVMPLSQRASEKVSKGSLTATREHEVKGERYQCFGCRGLAKGELRGIKGSSPSDPHPRGLQGRLVLGPPHRRGVGSVVGFRPMRTDTSLVGSGAADVI